MCRAEAHTSTCSDNATLHYALTQSSTVSVESASAKTMRRCLAAEALRVQGPADAAGALHVHGACGAAAHAAHIHMPAGIRLWADTP